MCVYYKNSKSSLLEKTTLRFQPTYNENSDGWFDWKELNHYHVKTYAIFTVIALLTRCT